MKITTELVKNLADLSRLEFSDDKIQEFKSEFEKTLDQVEQIKKVDTSKVDEAKRTLDAKTELREDNIKPSLTQQEALSQAPKKQQGMFKIEKIIS
jgi:aspartyl-tRNA(Asn)/glutamyl-tRNA(Gln) amidotransferase subunit C